jgi:hypothetical protein
MNLREEILKEHSKAQCNKIVSWVGSAQPRFDELFQLFIADGDEQVRQRAAWPVSYCVVAHPSLIKKHFSSLLKNLHQPHLHNAIKRNSIRMLQYVAIPRKHHGQVMNLCFEYLASPVEAIAVKAFSLTVLANLSALYSAIIPEIKLLIETQSGGQSAGFKSRAKKVLKQLGP